MSSRIRNTGSRIVNAIGLLSLAGLVVATAATGFLTRSAAYAQVPSSSADAPTTSCARGGKWFPHGSVVRQGGRPRLIVCGEVKGRTQWVEN